MDIRRIRIVEWDSIFAGGALVVVLITAIGTLGDFGVQILLAQSVSVAWYGDYSIAYAVLILGGIVAILGADRTCMRFLPGYIERGDTAHVAGFCLLFVALSIVVSLLIVAGFAIVHYALDDRGVSFFDTRKGHPVLLSVWLIPFYAVYRLAPGVLSAAHRPVGATITTRFGVPLVTAAAVLLIPFAGFKITPEAMLAAFALSFLLVSIAVVMLLPRDVPVWCRDKSYRSKLWLGVSLPIMIGAFVWKLNGYSGMIMLEVLGKDEAQVGLFTAATAAGALVMIPMTALTATILPRLGAIAQGEENYAARQALYGQATRQLTFFTVVVALPILLLPEQVLGLFGSDYQAVGGLLIVIAVTFMITGSIGIAAPFLQFCGYEKLILYVTIGSTLLDVVLCTFLVPRFEAYGAASSFLVRGLIADGIAVYALWRFHGLVPFVSKAPGWLVPVRASAPDGPE
ncbi:polysaccharide biosynthesis C-terminal domain-containing protein [Microbaculum marinum]|uniref:Polysaccharide biosynthesis C-terminal domain-containing protein n=1 Tax=Microbaculum marinum TaxID=1764581 RepID=A0AAW9RMC4_9HYPH